MKTLIVDEANLIEFYKDSLTREISVDFSSNPEEAIEIIKKYGNKYDRVITEILFNNSRLNGIDVINSSIDKCIKERIILTSLSNPIYEKIQGVSLFIRKPISKEKIRQLSFESIKSLKNQIFNYNMSERLVLKSAKSFII